MIVEPGVITTRAGKDAAVVCPGDPVRSETPCDRWANVTRQTFGPQHYDNRSLVFDTTNAPVGEPWPGIKLAPPINLKSPGLRSSVEEFVSKPHETQSNRITKTAASRRSIEKKRCRRQRGRARANLFLGIARLRPLCGVQSLGDAKPRTGPRETYRRCGRLVMT